MIAFYLVMHVTSMDRVGRTVGDGEAMHVYVWRERLERLQAEGRVPRRGKGRERARRGDADGEGTSQGNYIELEPQREIREGGG